MPPERKIIFEHFLRQNVPQQERFTQLLAPAFCFVNQDQSRDFYFFRTKDASYNIEDGSVRMYIRGRPVQLFAPSPLIDAFSLSKVSPAPQQKLKLEWVYGYRGRDARSNLYLLPTGEIVYFVAAVVVLFNAEEHSQRHYLGHTEEIKW